MTTSPNQPPLLAPALAMVAALAMAAAASAGEPLRVLVSLSGEKQLAAYTLDDATGTVALESRTQTHGGPGAMCFNANGDHLYVALKDTNSIAAYRMGDASGPVLLGEVGAGGYAGYLSVHPSGKFLLSSYYGQGQAAVHRIQDDGTLSADPVQVLETDEKAHAIVSDPAGRFVFVPHTRPQAIFQFVFDPETGLLAPNDPPRLVREAESGPRHLWFHPRLACAYGSDEQGRSVTTYQLDNESGVLEVVETMSSLPAGGFMGKGSTSDIEVHPSGKFVYIANRGDNTIAGFAIDQATGRLTLLQHTPVEPVPRSFNISPDGRYLVAAGQTSGKLAVFRIQPGGLLEHAQTLDSEGSPWWVVFQPR